MPIASIIVIECHFVTRAAGIIVAKPAGAHAENR
jgi:hypothetical protein